MKVLMALLENKAVSEIADEKLAAYATELEISNEGYTDWYSTLYSLLYTLRLLNRAVHRDE